MLLNEKAEALRDEADDMITLPVAMPTSNAVTIVTDSQSSTGILPFDSQLDNFVFDTHGLGDVDSQSSVVML